MSTIIRPVALTASDQLVFTGQTTYWGICVRETAGAVAQVRVYDNTSATGTLVDVVALAANGSITIMHPHGLRCFIGVYVDIVAGTVEGSIRMG
jgi:hypothetical protein